MVIFFFVTDQCEPNPCQNGGTCVAVTGSYICLCLSTYVGIDCVDMCKCYIIIYVGKKGKRQVVLVILIKDMMWFLLYHSPLCS